MSEFAVVPHYNPFETPESYVSKLAAANGAASIDHFLRLIGIAQIEGAVSNEARTRKILEMAGLDVDAVWINVRRGNDSAILGHHPIKKEDVSLHKARYCPICVAADIRNGKGHEEIRAYQRFWWHWISMDRCIEHGCDMVTAEYDRRSSLPDFTRFLGMNRYEVLHQAAIAECRLPHGADIYFWSRLVGTDAAAPILDLVSLQTASLFCETVGELVEAALPDDYSGIRGDHRRAGYGVVTQGEQALRDLFETNLRRKPKLDTSNKYGRLYKLLDKHLDDPDWEPLIDIVRRDALDTLPFDAGDTVLGHVLAKRRLHSVWTVYQQYGFHPKTTSKLFRGNGLLDPDVTKTADRYAIFDAEKADEVLCKMRDSLDTKDVLRGLDVTHAVLTALRNAGILRPIDVGVVFGETRPRYVRADYDAIVATINAVPVEPELPTRYRPILTSHRWSKVRVPGVFKAILDGKVRCARASDLSTLSALYVHESDVLAFRPIKNDGLPFKQVRDLIGISESGMAVLVKNGIIGKTIGSHPINGQPVVYYAEEDVQKFRENFIGVTELTARTGIRYLELDIKLRDAGLFPISERDGHRTASFYRRKLVAKLFERDMTLANWACDASEEE